MKSKKKGTMENPMNDKDKRLSSHRGRSKKVRMWSMLSDDLVDQILKKVNKDEDMKSFSLVCKQWSKVERLSHSSLRVRKPEIPMVVLGSFPNLIDVRLMESYKTRKRKNKQSWYRPIENRLKDIVKSCPKLETLMICSRVVPGARDKGILGTKGLQVLGERCPKLSTVMFQGLFLVGEAEVAALCKWVRNLKSLHLADNFVLLDNAFRAIALSSISALELNKCHKFTDEGLRFLANGSTSKTLKKLILAGMGITDTGIQFLVKMRSLEHLELKDLLNVTDVGGVVISEIKTLRELILTNLWLMSENTVVALGKNCCNLEAFALCQSVRDSITEASVHAFAGHKCLKHLALFGFALEPSDVERIVLGCPSLESLVLDESEDGLLEYLGSTREDKVRRVLMFSDSSIPLPHSMPTTWW